ncbi:MAG: PSD1 and planctomycete cytochrome C domain-containing protein [Verrucomicrobiota bacterium]
MNTLKSFATLPVMLLTAATGVAQTAKVDFERQVYPIFQKACFECHGAEKQKGKLRLDTREAAMKGGSSGGSIVPGKAKESELYRRITLPAGHDDVMPNRGEPLSKAQTDLIGRWINEGARWPDGIKPAPHWAYVKPERPPLPQVKSKWPKNEIDYFILARLEQEGLPPSPEADKARLLRRVHLDLVGLPPSPQQVEAFLKDTSAKAYERVVDELLASPQYGERWARPWLDLARYADSHGFQRDDLRDVWAYRDWVINALNADMPFDRFTIEQLAGDLLPNATVDQKIATGFHRCAPTNVEAGTDREENRVNQVFDRVNTTAAVWLGTTMECAQCHDHKYDPFTQKDYYQLFAYFNNTEMETDFVSPKAKASLKFVGPYLPLPDRNDTQRAELQAQIEALDEKIAGRTKQLAAEQAKWEQTALADLANAAQLHPLEVAEFDSSGDSNYRILADKSVLLVDDAPDRDTYTITVNTKLTGITGFKLEALTDPSLPGNGPGRGDEKRPNFVLNSFTITAKPAGGSGKGERVALKSAEASFSQGNFPVKNLLMPDNGPRGGWAIGTQFHMDHWATFETEKPVGSPDGATLTFTLVQNFGGGRTIGRVRLSAFTGSMGSKALPADVVKALGAPAEKRTAAQKKQLADFYATQDKPLALHKLKRAELEKEMRAIKAAQTLVMQELDQPRMATMFVRGNFLEKGAPVKATTPAVLHKAPGGPENRLTLARWLVDKDNPLAARVTVNRWWAEFFGRGIVSTLEDFGVKGETPTHPELLDWLATEFMARGWSMKHIHKLIVMSATYRQSSKLTTELLARDDQNKLYARGPRFRLDAESIRDNALAASGLLSLKLGGPPVRPYQPPGLWENKVGGERVTYETSEGEDAYRRGIYVVWKRGSPYPSFVNFDATARTACVIKRSRSNTPLQALTLLNDPVYVEAAMALARRVLNERPDASVEARIEHAFRLCLTRAPKVEEMAALKQLFAAQAQAYAADAKAAQALIGKFELPKGINAGEFAAWHAVTTALLNLDEMITKG